jgi:hypothetical protein
LFRFRWTDEHREQGAVEKGFDPGRSIGLEHRSIKYPPVMKEASSLAKKSAAEAASSTVPILPNGIAPTTCHRFSSDH